MKKFKVLFLTILFLSLFFLGVDKLVFSMGSIPIYCWTQSVSGSECVADRVNNRCNLIPGISGTVDCYKWCEDASQANCTGCHQALNVQPGNMGTSCIEHKDAYERLISCFNNDNGGFCTGSGTIAGCETCGCCSREENTMSCPTGTTTIPNGQPVVGFTGTAWCEGCRDDEPDRCRCGSNLKPCYGTNQPPENNYTQSSSAGSSYGCVANQAYVGKVANNKLTVTALFRDTGCYSVVSCINRANVIKTLQFWFSPAVPTGKTYIKDYDGGINGYNTQAMTVNRSSFGLMIKKDNTYKWDGVYVPGRLFYVGTPIWIRGGNVKSGFVTDIRAPGSYTDLLAEKKMIGVSDVVVSDNGSYTTAKFTLEFYNNQSGLAANTWQQILDGKYKISVSAHDMETYKLEVPVAYENVGISRTIDLTNPVVDFIDTSASTGSKVNVSWQVRDSTTKILKTFGDADVATGFSANGTIDDLTSNKLNYVLGSGATGATLFTSTNHLWSLNGTTTSLSRIENVDLKNNTDRDIEFKVIPFDQACNMTSKKDTINIPPGGGPPVGSAPSWITTKGGLVYSDSGANISVPTFSTHDLISIESYWNDPFSFYRDQVDITTEILMTKASTLPSLIHTATMKGVRLVNTGDTNNKSPYWFDTLTTRNDEQVIKSPTSFTVINNTGDLSVTTSSTDSGCVSTKNCVIKVTGNLRIERDFSCNARTVFLVTGTTTIVPDMTASADRYGCMVVSKGNISIMGGLWRSSGLTYPGYDLVQGMLLTEARIRILVTDTTRVIKDGLRVDGSLISFATDVNPAIQISRVFDETMAANYPSLAVHFDNRYLNFSTIFFGGDREGFKREVGFKPL